MTVVAVVVEVIDDRFFGDLMPEEDIFDQKKNKQTKQTNIQILLEMKQTKFTNKFQ